MRSAPFRLLRNLATTGAVMVLISGHHTLLHGQQGAPTLPPGEGRELVTAACTQCHNLRATLMRRDGREGWERLVEDMVLRGAHLTPEETTTIVQYLVQNFGPGSRSAPSSAQGASPSETMISLPPGPGKELVETHCSLCHDLSRIVSQPRTRPEWERITKDMMARGAQATDQQVQTIVSYLAAQFGKEGK